MPLALLPLAPEKRPISLWLWWLGFAGDEGAKVGRCGRRVWMRTAPPHGRLKKGRPPSLTRGPVVIN